MCQATSATATPTAHKKSLLWMRGSSSYLPSTMQRQLIGRTLLVATAPFRAQAVSSKVASPRLFRYTFPSINQKNNQLIFLFQHSPEQSPNAPPCRFHSMQPLEKFPDIHLSYVFHPTLVSVSCSCISFTFHKLSPRHFCRLLSSSPLFAALHPRYNTRGINYQPSCLKKKRKFGFLKRLRTYNGRLILQRRMLKGRKWLSH